MRPPFYMNQLKRDLDHWAEKGLVDEENRAAILETAGQSGDPVPVVPMTALIVMVILGIGAYGFLDAQLAEIPAMARIAVSVLVMWGLYGLSMIFLSRGRIAIGQSVLFLGLLVLGFAINIVDSVFRVSIHYPDQIMVWAVAVLIAAFLMRSRAALGLTLVLATVWTTLETVYFGIVFHWPFLALWIACLALVHVFRWHGGMILAIASLLLWMLLNTTSLGAAIFWQSLQTASLHALGWTAAWLLFRALEGTAYPFARLWQRVSLALAFITLFQLKRSIASIDLRYDWLVAASVGVGLIILLSLVALGRKGIRVQDTVPVAVLALFAMGYPIAYGQLYLSVPNDVPLIIAGSILYLALAVWLIGFGRWSRDNWVISLGCLAIGADLLYLYTALVTFGDNLALYLSLGAGLAILIVFMVEGLRRSMVIRERAKAVRSETMDGAEGPAETDPKGEAS